jgi:putative SOS response-associated peptidase YedK
MCGRFTLTSPVQAVASQFNLPDVPAFEPRYNIAPTQPVAAVRATGEAMVRTLVKLHWGLIPFWAKDPEVGARLINARSETVAEKPAFREAFRRRRCLVLADGFYEWQKQDGGKQPFYIHLHDGLPFAFAGLWERCNGPEGLVESCTLLTTQPNELMRPLHNRMPVILEPKDYDLWIDPGIRQTDLLLPLLSPYPAEQMAAFPVSRRVNNPDYDDPQCIVPLPHGESSALPGL